MRRRRRAKEAGVFGQRGVDWVLDRFQICDGLVVRFAAMRVAEIHHFAGMRVTQRYVLTWPGPLSLARMKCRLDTTRRN